MFKPTTLGPSFPPKTWISTPLPGWNYFVTPRGYGVLELDFVADPGKRSEEFIEEAKRTQPSDRDYRREYLRDWTASSGAEFYPEFQGIRNRVVQAPPGFFAHLPIYRAFDFGRRHPACVWFQRVIHKMEATIVVYREFMPADLGTHDFRDCVLHLSGQMPYDALTPLSMEWINRINRGGEYPPAPWFVQRGALPLQFEDFAGHEALQQQSNVQNNEDRTAVNIFAARGVYLNCLYAEVENRVSVVRRLFREVYAGKEALFIDPACVLLVRALAGGLHYPKGTPGTPIPDAPRKDGFYENIHDAFGYGVMNVMSSSDPERSDPRVEYQDREPQLVQDQGPTMGFYETEKGRR